MSTHGGSALPLCCGTHRPRGCAALRGQSCPIGGPFAPRIAPCPCGSYSFHLFSPRRLPSGLSLCPTTPVSWETCLNVLTWRGNLCQATPIVYYYYSHPREGRRILHLCVRQSCFLISFVVCFYALLCLERRVSIGTIL